MNYALKQKWHAEVGFGSLVARGCRAGIDPGLPLRTRYSFYVEAVK
jgi:hypothetical protein